MVDALGAGARERARMLAEVGAGLAQPQKELPPKYFYDARGARLFDRITQLPEYYLTQAEIALLREVLPRWLARLAPRSLIELGPGGADKARLLLGADRARRLELYVPIDRSRSYLRRIRRELSAEYDSVRVEPVLADISESFVLLDVPRPALFAFLGSTIGNFDSAEATALLRRVRRLLGTGEHFLLGADLIKDASVLEAAYNDAEGITAEFNRNILRVLNRELGADFDPDAFEHHAFYRADAARIEMHLVSRRAQRVRIPGLQPVRLRSGETIRTEISCKYDRARIEELLGAAGLRLTEWHTGRDRLFALSLAVVA